MSAILEAKGLYKSYRLGQSQVKVLQGLDLSVEAGEFAVIVGASGSGKSTLLHLLGGLDRSDKGSVYFEGVDLEQMSGRELGGYRNRTVGFVFQFYHLIDELTVLENVMVPAMARRSIGGWLGARGNVKKRAKELLDQLGLGGRIAHKPYQLSGGERQRAAIGRAVINEPRILLADEPTGNLDSETGDGILEVLGRLHRDGLTLLLVTHDERIGVRSDRMIRLADGRIEGQS